MEELVTVLNGIQVTLDGIKFSLGSISFILLLMLLFKDMS